MVYSGSITAPAFSEGKCLLSFQPFQSLISVCVYVCSLPALFVYVKSRMRMRVYVCGCVCVLINYRK